VVSGQLKGKDGRLNASVLYAGALLRAEVESGWIESAGFCGDVDGGGSADRCAG
jgi:hypothetical protein